MAVNKVISSSSLVIEIENGKDKTGTTVYKKKTFSSLKTDAAAKDIYDVAVAIQGVLSVGAKDTYLNDNSKLVKA
jgi:hypothetical protein